MKTLLAWLALSASAFAACTGSSPTWTSTIDQASVTTCISSATSGDTINVSAGSATWSSLAIPNTKGLTLACPTPTCTIAGAIALSISSNATLGTRITGFSFTGAGGSGTANVEVSGSTTSAAWRIDHNNFDLGADTAVIYIEALGNGPGLIDHNTMKGGGASEMIHDLGLGASNNGGWFDDVTPGSGKMVYIEDNTANNYDTTFLFSFEEAYYGARLVIRHNIINFGQLDVHGTSGEIWNRWFEAYNNLFDAKGNNLANTMQVRGGSGLFYSNQVQNQAGGDPTPGVGIDVESTSCTGSYPAAAYPIIYQAGQGLITGSTTQHASPLYFWSNTVVPSGPMPIAPFNGTVGNTASCLALNTDYFTPGSPPTTISVCETAAQVTATCPATFTYTAFTYPYPLLSSGLPNPNGSSATSSNASGVKFSGVIFN